MVKILYEQEPLNPVNLEKALGLSRGDIVEITIYPEGAVGVDYLSTPTDILKDKVEVEIKKRGLIRGKKPAEE